MASQQPGSRKKGTFHPLRLTVSKAYVTPRSRAALVKVGGVAALALVMFVGADWLALNGRAITAGDLSSNHAMLSSQCQRCHDPINTVPDRLCSRCHEKTGADIGVYSFASHYLYRSGDMGRIKTASLEHGRMPMDCASCHIEHKGTNAPVTDVPDARCVRCHDYGSFNDNHPEFAYLRNKLPDDSTLLFTHIKHTKLVVEKLQKETGGAFIEKACLYCHTPEPDGKNFTPIDYDKHCGDCHLTTSTETPSLQVRNAADPAPGVETLDMIKARGELGTRWAYYMNVNEFRYSGARVSKSPVYHEDPWVMENLKQIQRVLYTDAGILDLLRTGGPLPLSRHEEAYREAVTILRSYVDELRSRPEQEVQAELAILNGLIRRISRSLDLGLPMPADAMLLSGKRSPNPNISPAQRQALEEFAQKIARPCMQCHIITGGMIQRVRADQTYLIRSQFDHKSHIVDRRCLDCHNQIPITKEMAKNKPVDPLMDRSAVQNMSGKESCAECHAPSKASNRCVTCHAFHPNKTNRQSLQLFVDR